jgi:hypothetical protein
MSQARELSSESILAPAVLVRGGGGQDWIRLTFPVALLRRLMETGAIGAAELGCLDDAAKDTVRRLCLECCAKRLGRCSGQGSPCEAPGTECTGPARARLDTSRLERKTVHNAVSP